MTAIAELTAAREDAKALEKLCRAYRRAPTPELGAEIRTAACALTDKILRLHGPDLDTLGKIAKTAAYARGVVAREDWRRPR